MLNPMFVWVRRPMTSLFLLVSLLFALFVKGEEQLPSGNETKVPLNVLVLVPWPDRRDFDITGWDYGLAYLAGARVAVEEVNTREDVLHGYELKIIAAGHEACDLSEVALGVSNLVYHAVNPNTDNIAAILGLYCSASSIYLSEIASTRGVNLIEMAVSNSPIFKQNLDQYRHQWRFLLSASVFADMMIEFMKTYGWTRVGLVQDLRSAYFVGIADAFVKAMRNNKDAELVYHGGLVGKMFVTKTLSDIRSSRVRVIFMSIGEAQVAALLCEAINQGMLYPHYMWVFADNTLDLIVSASSDSCDRSLLHRALKQSVMSFFDFETNDEIIIEPSMNTHGDFVEKYNAELSKVQVDYQQLLNETGDEIIKDQAYAGLLYDQVWAFALAVNHSLPELKLKNVSIEDYGFGQPVVTDVIEDSLQKLNFRGVTGQIHFNKYRETGPPVAVFQVTDTDEVPIGKCYTTMNGSISCAEVNISGVIGDDIESVVVKFPLAIGISCICFVCCVMLMVTIILALLLYHRNTPEVKAISLPLSLMMFLGSYFLCLAALLHALYTTFDLSNIIFSFLCNAQIILAVNGCNLIFVTLFIKLFRVSRIFNNKSLNRLGWKYSNRCLIAIVLFLCLLPEIILVFMLSYDPFERYSKSIYQSEGGLLQDDVQYFCYSPRVPLLWIILTFGYLGMFVPFISYLAISTRKIQRRDFKDTKKVNAFIFLTILSFSLPPPFSVIVLVNDDYYLGNSIIICGLLTLASLSQVILFLPKVLPIICGTRESDNWKDSKVLVSLKRNASLLVNIVNIEVQ